MELDYHAAIIGTIQFALGYGFWRLAEFCSGLIMRPVKRALLSWPCYAVGFIFLVGAAFTIVSNMFGLIVVWVWGLFRG
jgi:hypothetical protein